MVRCKVVCSFKQKVMQGVNLAFNAVYSGSKENEDFFAATPGMRLDLYTVNQAAAEQFEMGKEYYMDFTPCVPGVIAEPKDEGEENPEAGAGPG